MQLVVKEEISRFFMKENISLISCNMLFQSARAKNPQIPRNIQKKNVSLQP